jgi:RNase P subunit RPR2
MFTGCNMRIVINNNTIEVTCQRCKSVLAVTVGDIKDKMGLGTHVVCAACNTIVPVPVGKIPRHWREQLDWDE